MLAVTQAEQFVVIFVEKVKQKGMKSRNNWGLKRNSDEGHYK